jgi:t-SNARE complex subunit (syntaxin)
METKEFIRQRNNRGALLNVDNSGLNAYRRQREIMRNVSTHEERIKKIESSINEVKDLLLQLVENGKQ